MLETATLQEHAQRARDVAPALATLPGEAKDAVLLDLAERLTADMAAVLEANARDMQAAEQAGMEPAMLDRLHLTAQRLAGIASDVRQVASLPDPVGEEFDARTLPNGLRISRRRVPLGVIGVVYESR